MTDQSSKHQLKIFYALLWDLFNAKYNHRFGKAELWSLEQPGYELQAIILRPWDICLFASTKRPVNWILKVSVLTLSSCKFWVTGVRENLKAIMMTFYFVHVHFFSLLVTLIVTSFSKHDNSLEERSCKKALLVGVSPKITYMR